MKAHPIRVGTASCGFLTKNIAKHFGIHYEPVTGDTVFLTSKVAGLFRWWQAHAMDRLPLRSEFDITEHRGVAADIALVEVLPDGEYLVRIQGQNVIDFFGVNSMGRTVRDSSALGGFGEALAEHYDRIVDDRTCRRCTGNLELVNNRHWVEFESLDCPLSRDGRKVDFILGVIGLIGTAADDTSPPAVDDRGPGAGIRWSSQKGD